MSNGKTFIEDYFILQINIPNVSVRKNNVIVENLQNSSIWFVCSPFIYNVMHNIYCMNIYVCMQNMSSGIVWDFYCFISWIFSFEL